jgi:endogenous inhibitor of DNA gyrase (YacG/DUF329 family)
VTTLIHEGSRTAPMVYACKIEWPKAKGAVTSDNWYSALLELQETPQARESMRDVWEWERGIKTATKPKAEPKPKAVPVVPALPACPLCSARFSPEWKSVKYCRDCRTNRRAEVKRHICRQYQKRNPETKRARDRARHNTETTYTNCSTCGGVVALSPQSRHRLYCSDCRKVKDNEQKRAHDKKRAAIYKAAVAMGVTA